MSSRRVGLEPREVGVAYSLLRWLARWIPGRMLRVKVVYLIQLPRDRWVPPEITDGLRWATPDDLDRIRALPLRPPGVEARLARGGRPVVKELDGQVVGCTWFEPSAPLYEGWLQFQLDDDEYWLSDTYVASGFRGQGITGQIGHYGRSLLPSEVAKLGAVVTALNTSSRRSAEKSGYDTVRIAYLRFLGCTIVKLPGHWGVGFWRPGHPLMLPLRSAFSMSAPEHRNHAA